MAIIQVKCLTLKDMVTVSAIGTMDVHMRDTGRMIWQMDKANLLIQMGTFIRECGRTIREMVTVKKP